MVAFLVQHRWRATLCSVVMLALLLSLVIFTSSHSSSSVSARGLAASKQISSDPYTNSNAQHQTEVEPDTYSYGQTVVAAFQAGRFYNEGSSNIGWATSTNSGRTWTRGFLPGITVYAGGTYNRVSDPSVAYDAAHKTWIISSLAIVTSARRDVIVSRSTNGGLTWSTPVAVAVSGSTTTYDKDWIVCDTTPSSPFYGHCYVEWDDSASNGLILMSTSTDGGKTWGAPTGPANKTFSGIGGQPLVQPGGKVIVPIYGTDLTTGLDNIYSFTSTDGGKTWTSPVTVSPVTYHVQTASYRGGSLPSAEIDGAGKVYVVWSDCRFEADCIAGDIVLTTSTDGTTWSPVQRIPIQPAGSGVDRFTAGIAVDKTTSGNKARLALTFYSFANTNCFTYNCQLNVGFVSSTNGGASWSSTKHLAGPMLLPWLADTTSGFMTGDYISTSIVGNNAVAVFPFATPPSGGHLNEAMYTGDTVLQVEGGSLTSQGVHVVVTPHAIHRTIPMAPNVHTAD